MLSEEKGLVEELADFLRFEDKQTMSAEDRAVMLLEVLDAYLRDNVVNINVPSEGIVERN